MIWKKKKKKAHLGNPSVFHIIAISSFYFQPNHDAYIIVISSFYSQPNHDDDDII